MWLEDEEDMAFIGLFREIAILAICNLPTVATLKALYFDP